MNYYNEIDPFAAEWLERLIVMSLIPDGHVDTRSIVDVTSSDLKGYTQCHFFAGIAGWPLALQMAGWPDDRPVWTGSCPCQPFSNAGQQKAADDDRHLWPAFRDLIAECGPATVFGEQVASKLGREWLATVRAEMEALGYAVGAADLCAAGVGAPHIRQRLWFVGERLDDTDGARSQGRTGMPSGSDQRALGASGMARGLADADEGERRRFADGEGRERDGKTTGRDQGDRVLTSCGEHGGLADATTGGRREERADLGRGAIGDRAQGQPAGYGAGSGNRRLADAASAGRQDAGSPFGDEEAHGGARRVGRGQDADHGSSSDGQDGRPRPYHEHWRDADWLFCRDGKWRPVEPGTFPLVDGVPSRVGRLRAYGNAIVPQVAATFIRAYLEC